MMENRFKSVFLDTHLSMQFPLLPLKHFPPAQTCVLITVTLAAARGLRLGDVTEYK